jgi:TPR repeat protein
MSKHLIYVVALALSIAVAACAMQSQPTQVGRTSILAADALQRGQVAYDRQDYLIAFREWLPLAQHGIALAQHKLGVMYMNGQGVAHDDAQAVRWYHQAAAQGFTPAQNNLGLMYAEGRGVTKDEAKAVQLYTQAANQGYALAQHNLGQMDEQGRGVTRDLGEAQRWYAKAAELYPPGPQRVAAIEARDRVARQLASSQAHSAQPSPPTPPAEGSSPPETQQRAKVETLRAVRGYPETSLGKKVDLFDS